MTERINHAAEAMLCVNAAHRADTKSESNSHMQQAQVHATLALVEQQRIANLIAVWSMSEEDRVRLVRSSGMTYSEEQAAAPAIREGLGL